MSDYRTAPRLFLADDFAGMREVVLSSDHSHYLANVMRIKQGETIRLFNAKSGEYRSTVAEVKKKAVTLQLAEKLRDPHSEADIRLFPAPIKKAHFDTTIMKATELGATSIQPILTNRTQIREVNIERLNAIAIEAAEQSERLSVPEILAPLALTKVVEKWESDRLPLICAEFGEAMPIFDAFSSVKNHPKIGILTGPEGGFQPKELALLSRLPSAKLLRLGPRILRADTAAIAALACWQSICGDWRNGV
jgi:16S rRNA (uracil1498-N3)-methyltransferase